MRRPSTIVTCNMHLLDDEILVANFSLNADLFVFRNYIGNEYGLP